MRKFLLSAAFMGSVCCAVAHTGSMVREDRVWNYDITGWMGDYKESEHTEDGFHFDGTKTIDGNVYAVFRNDEGAELSLIRQDGEKVYLRITDELKDHYVGENEVPESEVLLYDFSAEVGDTYPSITFDEQYLSCWSEADVTVISKSFVNVDEKEVTRLTLEYKLNENQIYQYQAVEGIGISSGRLDRPQCAWLASGMNFIYATVNSVTNSSGEVIFTGKDFKPQNYMVREDRIWGYEAPYTWEWNGKYEFKMRFDGVEEADGHIYHKLIAYDAHLSWCKYPDPTPIVEKRERTDTYLLREEDGRVYLHKDENGFNGWGDFQGTEALLYDFNAEEGDELNIITDNCIATARVGSVAEVMVNGESCRSYDIFFSDGYLDSSYTIVEGLGNITWGYIPVFIMDLATGGGSMDKIRLEMVTDLEGNVIYESNGEWHGEFNSVAQIVATPGLAYEGQSVSAGEAYVALRDMAGQTVATGHGSVSTAGLQPGVYLATAGGRTLKILVR